MNSLVNAFKSIVTYQLDDAGQSLDDVFLKHKLPETSAEFISMLSVETDLIKRIILYKRFIKFIEENEKKNESTGIWSESDQSAMVLFFGINVVSAEERRDFLSRRLMTAYGLLGVASKPWRQSVVTSRTPLKISFPDGSDAGNLVHRELLAGMNFGKFNIQVHCADTYDQALEKAEHLHITHNHATNLDICVVLTRGGDLSREEFVFVDEERRLKKMNVSWDVFVVTNLGLSFKIDEGFEDLYRDIRDKHIRYDVDCMVTFLVYRIGQPGFLPLSHAMGEFSELKQAVSKSDKRGQYEQLYHYRGVSRSHGMSTVVMMSPLKASTFTHNTLHGQVLMVPMNLSLFSKFEALLLSVHNKISSKYVSVSSRQQRRWSVEYRELLIEDIKSIPSLMITKSIREDAISTLESDIVNIIG